MKKLIIGLTLFCSFALYGEEEFLIDFGWIVADTKLDGMMHNEATVRINPETGELVSLIPEAWTYEREPDYFFEDAVIDEDVSISPFEIREIAYQYPGETVFAISGSLSSAFPMVTINPPFEIPVEDETFIDQDGRLEVRRSETGKGDKYCDYGLLFNVGPIKEFRLNACNLGDPVILTLFFSDDQQNYFAVDYHLKGTNGAWLTYSFFNPTYWLELRFPDFNIPRLTLTGIGIQSLDVVEYWTERFHDTIRMTDDMKYRYEQSYPVSNLKSRFEVLLKDIVIVHGEHESEW